MQQARPSYLRSAPRGCENFSPCDAALTCADQLSQSLTTCGNATAATNTNDGIKYGECICGFTKIYTDW